MNSRAHPDHWTQKAKQLGYPARSVFKLEEIQKKWKPIRKNTTILDIGASPGSWSLFALRLPYKVAEVCAVDFQPLVIQAPPKTHLHFFQGDVFSNEAKVFLHRKQPYGCILSDAAPSTSGNRLVDCSRSSDLVMGVLDLVQIYLAPGGNCVVKVFQGGNEEQIRKRIKDLFENVRVFKPKAVRNESMEVYMIGLNKFQQSPN